jgi:hypothetical protein
VSDRERPGTKASEICPRRAWQRPHISTSLRKWAGRDERFGWPVPASRAQVTPVRSSKRASNPFDVSSLAKGDHSFAHATCADPSPWHASHPMLISFHVVWKLSVAGS